MKPTYEELEQERNELASRVERLRYATARLSSFIVFDRVDLRQEAEEQFAELQNILAETPPAALAALKAQWQAEALPKIADHITSEEFENQFIEEFGNDEQPGYYGGRDDAIWLAAKFIRQRAQEAGDE